MTAESTEPAPGDGEEELVQTPAPDGDWFLQALVSVANKSETAGFGVTLFVSGTIITGTLTSMASYFSNLGDEVEQGTGPDGGRELGDTFRSIGAQVDAKLKESPPTNPNFIHLRDALVILPNQPPIPMNRKVWWRGRICEVDGFILGTLSAS